jgi:hypothetical protein
MLQDRLAQYRKHWAAKGREPPSKDEWYEIADGEAEDSAEEWLEVVPDGKISEGIDVSEGSQSKGVSLPKVGSKK